MIGQNHLRPLMIGPPTFQPFNAHIYSSNRTPQREQLMLFNRQSVLIILASLIGLINASDNEGERIETAVPPPAAVNQLTPRSYADRVDGTPYRDSYRDGNPYNNRYDNNPYNDRVPPAPAAAPVSAVVASERYRHRHCQTEKYEHPVRMKKYSDSTGYWVLYTQIIETRNVANRCHRNEYVYLAHRQRAGWFWNPKISSLVHYSLGEPKFISRVVRHPERELLTVVVNMSRNYASSSVDLDRLFPRRLAREITRIGGDDTKWSETARTALPILQMDTAYFQTIVPRENTGSQHLRILHHGHVNREILE